MLRSRGCSNHLSRVRVLVLLRMYLGLRASKCRDRSRRSMCVKADLENSKTTSSSNETSQWCMASGAGHQRIIAALCPAPES